MLTLEWNPTSLEGADYVTALNACYGGGWDEPLFRWHLMREFAGRLPDVAVLFQDGNAVAGTGLNYRQLRGRDGRIVEAAIATAGWTLPNARRRGYLTRMMRESAERAGARGCEIVLGFVTADNPSRKAMARCGAHLVPSSYLVGNADDVPAGAADVERMSVPSAELHRWFPAPDRATCLHYRRAADWRGQFLERCFPVEALRVGHGCVALVERARDTDRLLLLAAGGGERVSAVTALARRAASRGRHFFTFSTGDWAATCAAEAGLERRRGSVAWLPTEMLRDDTAQMLASPWAIQSGDRM